MKYFIQIVILAILSANMAKADIAIDKAIAGIMKDRKTYIYSEARGSSEEEAYNKALTLLTTRISEYFQEELKSDPMPDGIYISKLSSLGQRLTSQISDHRYRVLLYIKKNDIQPTGTSDNSVMLAKDNMGNYNVATTNTIVDNEISVQNPIVTEIMSMRSKEELVAGLSKLRKGNLIGGAAAFPIAHVNDFYVVIIDNSGNISTVLRCNNGNWIDLKSGQATNPEYFKSNTAYWFTLNQQEN